MAHYPALDVVKLALTFHHASVDTHCEMTFFLKDSSGVVIGDPGGYATSFFGEAVTNLIPQLDPNVVLDGVVLENINALPYVGSDYPQTNQAGTLVYSDAETLPPSTCFAIKRVTANLGRSGRGRLYWPIWQHGWLVSAGAINNAGANGITAKLSAFQAGVEALVAGSQLGVVSFQHGGAAVNPGLFQPITAWAYTDLNIDSQRRRLLGRGR